MTRRTTAFLLHPASSLHDTGWGHPEHQGRLRSLASTVGKDMMALHGRVDQFMDPGMATQADLLRVHTEDHVRRIRDACLLAEGTGQVLDLDPETRVSDATWEAILGSVGSGITAARAVMEGRHRNAFVAARPPGHHATSDQAMGFCLINTVAAVARAVQAEGLAERVLIVDWDVHHGNGTQEIFWRDPSVYYLSLHQSPHFPGTGSALERGADEGEGATRNVPLPAGTDGPTFIAALEDALAGVAAEFEPDLVLVSAGYDGLAGDPLGGMALEPSDFHAVARLVDRWAEATCDARVVALLEGGYDPKRTGLATVATVRALAGIDVADPRAPVP